MAVIVRISSSILGRSTSSLIYSSRGAVELGRLLTPDLTDFLSDYTKVQVFNGRLDEDRSQVGGALVAYGDPAFDTLLASLTGRVGVAISTQLVPTYSFVRVYFRGQELVRHSDRPACEHSVSIHLSAASPDAWPLRYVDRRGEARECRLGPGEALAYEGCNLTHWRGPCPVDWYIQLFLHYVDAYGSLVQHRFDRRPYIGRPAEY